VLSIHNEESNTFLLDFKNDYKTMYTSYMESIWWVFKQLFDKGLVYRGYLVMPYSTACCTPLSNFEVQQNYKDVVDPAGKSPKLKHLNYMISANLRVFDFVAFFIFFISTVVISFPLKINPLNFPEPVAMLAWTTTPWTLPSNLALCVHPEHLYVYVNGMFFIFIFLLCQFR